jgi:RNA polymerase sigma factor (sigma-70 family)
VDQADTERCWNLFLAHHRQLQVYVRRLVSAEHDTTDIVHEVALRLLNQPSAPSCNESFGAWCKAVARHIVLQQRRALRYRRALLTEIDAGHQSDAWRAEALSTVRLAIIRQLNDIDPLSRELLLRRYVLEQTSDEIAHDTKLSPAAVRMRLMRLRDVLAKSLGDADNGREHVATSRRGRRTKSARYQ